MQPRRLLAIVATMALAAAVVLFWPTGDGTVSPTTAAMPDPVVPTTTLPPGPGAETEPRQFVPGVGWEVISSPLDGRLGAATAWSGSELFVWGGTLQSTAGPGPHARDGYVLEPGSGEWYALPQPDRPPLCVFLSLPRAIAAGDEVVLWGKAASEEGCSRAQAYHLESGAWRPLGGRFFEQVVPGTAVAWVDRWAGEEADLLVAPVAGLAYDLATGDTIQIPAMSGVAPDGSGFSPVSAHWTGEMVLALGSGSLHGWVPGADTWWDLGAPPLADAPRSSEWTDRGLLVMATAWAGTNDGFPGLALWEGPDRGWGALEAPPLRWQGYTAQALSVAGLPAVATNTGVAVLDDATAGWVPFPPAYRLGCCLQTYSGSENAVFAVGPRVLRLPIEIVDGRVAAPSTLRVGLAYLELPDGFRLRSSVGESPENFPDGSTGLVVAFAVAAPGGTCHVSSTTHHSEPWYPAPADEIDTRAGSERMPLVILEYRVGDRRVLAVPHPNGIDVVRVSCADPSDALALAGNVWVPTLDI